MAFQSLKGQLLLDNGTLHGSFFHRTVVLICNHDPEGAFGLVINRPTGENVGQAIAGKLSKKLKERPLYVGGPVQPQALSYLFTDGFVKDANVLPGLRLDHSLDGLIELGDSFSSTLQLRVFAGYAGWSPGQLDEEMKRETWLTFPARLDLVFAKNPQDLWPKILGEMGWRYRLIAEQPDDLSWN